MTNNIVITTYHKSSLLYHLHILPDILLNYLIPLPLKIAQPEMSHCKFHCSHKLSTQLIVSKTQMFFSQLKMSSCKTENVTILTSFSRNPMF